MNWKQFLKPTLPKIGWFLLFWIFIIPGPVCGPDGPCFPFMLPLLSWISPLLGIFMTFFRINHLLYPRMICAPVLINCKSAGSGTIFLYWILQWISLIVSYIVACIIVHYFTLKKK